MEEKKPDCFVNGLGTAFRTAREKNQGERRLLLTGYGGCRVRKERGKEGERKREGR